MSTRLRADSFALKSLTAMLKSSVTTSTSHNEQFSLHLLARSKRDPMYCERVSVVLILSLMVTKTLMVWIIYEEISYIFTVSWELSIPVPDKEGTNLFISCSSKLSMKHY